MEFSAVLIGCTLISFLFFITYNLGYRKGLKVSDYQINLPEPEIKPLDTPILNVENVLIEIVKQDIKFPLISLKQVILETQWLTCHHCSLDYKNLYGFGWNGKTYHKYEDWRESVYAYKQWQDTWYQGGDYYVFLDNVGYATDSEYVNKLKLIDL